MGTELTVRHSLEVTDDKDNEYRISTTADGERVQLTMLEEGKETIVFIPTEVWCELIYFNPEDDEPDDDEEG